MKFLLDSNLSHRVAQLLCDAGLDAVHTRDKGLQHATDSVIMEFARQHGFVLVSEDTDFGELLARQRTAASSADSTCRRTTPKTAAFKPSSPTYEIAELSIQSDS